MRLLEHKSHCRLMTDTDRLRAWIRERCENCHAIATEKYGADRYGWLEDARYFSETLEVIDRLAAAEREAYERAAQQLQLSESEIRLGAGEMGTTEMRMVRAVLAWRAAAIRALALREQQHE